VKLRDKGKREKIFERIIGYEINFLNEKKKVKMGKKIKILQ